MAAVDRLLQAVRTNGHRTLAEIRDELTEVDSVKVMQAVHRLDQLLAGNFSEDEIRAIYLGGLMVHLLPDER
jgi:hypothetical protein